jgi:Domain of unknown function (DUF4157)
MKDHAAKQNSAKRSSKITARPALDGRNGISIVPPSYGIGFVDQPPYSFANAAGRRAAFAHDQEEPHQSSQRAKVAPLVEGLQMKAASAPAQSQIEQPSRTNNARLPDDLKYGVEALSGVSLDGVNVHYNSSRPARFNASAYTQGRDIHIAPGQERYVPHEAWHVTQQAQGRVLPTIHTKDGLPVSYNQRLEHEADVMGARAAIEGRAALPSRFSREQVARVRAGSSQHALGIKAAFAGPGQSAGKMIESSISGGYVTAFDGGPRQMAKSDTLSFGLGNSAHSGVVQLGGFGAETTYGMELEFTNRWLTPLPQGKDAKRLELKEGAVFKESPEMTVTGDDGRGGNTVLEIESRVFAADDWTDDKVHKDVATILAKASDIISFYREKQPDLLKEEREVASGALKHPVDVDVLVKAEPLAAELERNLPDMVEFSAAESSYIDAYNELVQEHDNGGQKINELAAQLEKEVAALAHLLKIPNQPGDSLLDRCTAVDEAIQENIQPASKLLGALRPIVKGVGEESKATLQVTTLGRKGQGHAQALAETSAAITKLNYGRTDLAFVNDLQAGANEEAGKLIKELGPQGDPEIFEDFRVTLETAVKIIFFAERGQSGFGTVKNLPYVLPRRIITPPLLGFAAALGMDHSKYVKAVSLLQERLSKTKSAQDSTANDILLMLSRGMNQKASENYSARDTEWGQGTGLKTGNDPRFSLWTVEGGVPTLESDIIERAKKKDPGNWTAHELRHFGWATGMTTGELKPYLDLLKRQATKR